MMPVFPVPADYLLPPFAGGSAAMIPSKAIMLIVPGQSSPL